MAQRILIVGHGVAGRGLARSLKRKGMEPVGFLDNKSVHKDVIGKLEDVNQVIKKYRVTDIYFAIPSAPSSVVRDFVNSVENDKVKISILPRSFKTISKESVSISELTDVDIMAMIGRQPIKHDLMASKELIEGKVVMVTGAAGTIGSRLAKLVSALNPEKLICVDWWENGMFFLQQDMGQAKHIVYKIADIKNPHLMDKLLGQYKPDVLLHAAAYKHVPLMEDNPVEAFNNNVWGSLNLMRNAVKHEVKNFVLVSTDKAVNPANVMGTTKRLAEMLLETLAHSQTTTKFSAVRFGNVIQSNGSVMQIFKRQIERGESLTITHKDVTRYFMTVEEAAQLVIQSAALGKSGEIFVLDMGEPIKVMDLAKSLVKVLGKPIKIKVIGLRPGEKMFEELSYSPKNAEKTANNKIFVVKNEKAFEHGTFVESIDKLVENTLPYKLTSDEVVSALRDFGFRIKESQQ